MQFLNYFLASLVSYFGLVAGILLVRIAPEEQKPLGKYFLVLRKILVLLIFIFLAFYYHKNLIYISALAVFFILAVFLEYKGKDSIKKSMVAYAMLGFLFFLGSQNKNLFLIESSLIFLYGMPAASLIYNKKNMYVLLLKNSVFVLIANLLYFVTISRPLF